MSRLPERKVALVTGADRGLGRAYAPALAEAGASVLVNDLGGAFTGGGADPKAAQNVAGEIEAMGGRTIADTTNIGDWDACGAMVQTAITKLGGLDIVVNNGQKRWSRESLERALAEVDRQDGGYMIAPSARSAAPSPSDETLASLHSVNPA
jgi:NAD(P)-dependent dehydrogenase (short-subunit alcohol dehydrogenase family)